MATVDPSVGEQMNQRSCALLYVKQSRGFHWITGQTTLTPIMEATVTHSNRKISIEYATIFHPNVPAALSELKAQFPQIAGYTVTFDAHNMPIEDAANFKPDEDYIVRWWFHGTSTAFLPQIQARGLAPRSDTGRVPSFMGGAQASQPNMVYLASDDGNDVRFAAREANLKAKQEGMAGQPIVLKIDSRKLSFDRLRPDEDAQKTNWKESVETYGTAAYQGTIRPDAISPHLVIGPDGKWQSA